MMQIRSSPSTHLHCDDFEQETDYLIAPIAGWATSLQHLTLFRDYGQIL